MPRSVKLIAATTLGAICVSLGIFVLHDLLPLKKAPSFHTLMTLRRRGERKRTMGFNHNASSSMLVIYVRSSPQEFEMRNALRATWISHLKSLGTTIRILIYFAVGNAADSKISQQLDRESHAFGDIILLDFVESYRNLSVKTREILLWHTTHYQSATLFWTNTDGLVFPEGLLQFFNEIQTNIERERIIFGYCTCTGECLGLGYAKPQRNYSDKYYIPYDMWPGKTLPHYCMGYSILMTPGAVAALLKVAARLSYKFLQDFFVDDVLYTGAIRLWAENKIELDNRIELFRPLDVLSMLLSGKDTSTKEKLALMQGSTGTCFLHGRVLCVAAHMPKITPLGVKTWWNQYLRILISDSHQF